jgi:hypothetical protein
MAVPNTTTFSLQDVVTDLGCAGNLTACFAAAIDATFDPLYKGSKNNLLNFRNYGGLFVSIDIVAISYSYDTTPCTTYTVTITASGTWTAIWLNSGSSAEGAFHATKYSGAASDTVTITAIDTNLDAFNLTDTFRIILDADVSKIANVACVQYEYLQECS